MNTLTYLINEYKLDLSADSPIEIPNVSRNDLAEWLHDLDFETGVEVGVAAGEYSEIICKANPQMKVYGVDPFGSYKGYKDYVRTKTFNDLHQQAQARLRSFPKYVFVKEFSLDALKRFEDSSLDFVYIDANHQEPYISQDIEGWSRKGKSGGIVAGHDYIHSNHSHCDVIQAVNLYTAKNKITPWFILGLNAKIPGIIRDASRSWMWIKS